MHRITCVIEIPDARRLKGCMIQQFEGTCWTYGTFPLNCAPARGGAMGSDMRRAVAIAAFLVLALAIIVIVSRSSDTTAPDLTGSVPADPDKAIPAAASSPPEDGNWTMPGKDYAHTRFSGLPTSRS
jgi:hypothetical protein